MYRADDLHAAVLEPESPDGEDAQRYGHERTRHHGGHPLEN